MSKSLAVIAIGWSLLLMWRHHGKPGSWGPEQFWLWLAIVSAALVVLVPPLLPDRADAPVQIGLAVLSIAGVFLAEWAGRRGAG